MKRPRIVCLCGSTRFGDAFAKAQNDLTLDGNIVLSVGNTANSDDELFTGMGTAERRLLKARLDVLHLHKILLCDEVYVLNQDGYIGESTEREIEFAKSLGKVVRYLEPPSQAPKVETEDT